MPLYLVVHTHQSIAGAFIDGQEVLEQNEMKIKYQYIVAGLLAAVTTAGLAVASPDDRKDDEKYFKQRGPLPFEVYEQNGDGVLSAEEFADVKAARASYRAQSRAEKHARRFEAMDANGDGMISIEEYRTYRTERMNKRGCKGKYWSS